MRRGFTMVEMLVVMSVLAVLMGLLMPMLGIARKAARKSASLSVMHKVDTALHLFRGEMGVYPYQLAYADVDAGAAWTNRLYYHVGSNIDPLDLDKVRQDADTAGSNYDYPLTRLSNGILQEPSTFASIHTYRSGDVIHGPRQDLVGYSRFGPIGTAVLLNRLAKERARLAIWSGNIAATGLKLPDQYSGSVQYQPLPGTARAAPTSTTPLVSSPASATKPGWAADYLNGELEKRYISGEAVLDAYKRPLLYVCQVQEGVRPPRSPAMLDDFCTLVDRQAYGFATRGRTTLADTLPDAAPALPDHTRLRHSDRRAYAGKGFELEFELWSAGPDGKCSWMRDDPRNQDNLPLTNYDRSIP